MATNVSDPAAQQYAKALFLSGTEKGCIGQVYDELNALYQAYRGDKTFRAFFTSPKVPGEVKNRIVLSALGGNANEITRGLVALLVRKRRETLLDNIFDAFAKFRDEAEHRVHVFIESAAPMEADVHSQLVAAITKAIGKTVQLHETVNPALIGGVRIRIGDSLIDNTLLTRLESLFAMLLDRDSVVVTGDVADADALFQRAQAAARK